MLTKLQLLEVLKEMQRLPQNIREVIYLRISGDLSFKEIGEILGKSKAGYNRSTFYHYFSDIYELLEYVENDLLSYFFGSLGKSEEKNPEYIFKLFEDKELHVKALLGKYGSIRFLERIKEKFPVDEDYDTITSDSSLTPYLIEFHVSTSLSLFHLWLNRNKDLPAETLFTLIHNLYISGIKTYLG